MKKWKIKAESWKGYDFGFKLSEFINEGDGVLR
jgi:hypothetical protein